MRSGSWCCSFTSLFFFCYLFFFQAEDGIRDPLVTGVQTCALPISGLFIASFSTPVSSVSIDLGDYGQDRDTLSLSAFSGANASGALLGSATDTLAADQIGRASCRERVRSRGGVYDE